MHIKQVIVSGFRSYKGGGDATSEPFSRQHNVVVGRNGTGKSNFFDAIRFVLLTSRFANLRPDERQALLHEGAGKHVLAAFVEIVFDNSDGRLPVDSDEVVLRRTIGVKKDEFFLNRKHITKSDVVHLLESAGFSRANPYYIVQQGKVNALAVMKERARLELLKEVAGTKVYEERRLESLQLLHETQSRREKIHEVIRYIDTRLTELAAEKDELRAYQQLDREQRALEYAMHDKALASARSELGALDQRRVTEAAATTTLHDQQLRVHRDVARVQETAAARLADRATLAGERDALEAERTQLLAAHAELELEAAELEDQARADAAKRNALTTESATVQRRIAAYERELNADVRPAFDEARAAYDGVAAALRDRVRESDALIAKQSRKSQFATQDARDAYLTREVAAIETVVAQKQADTAALRQAAAALDTAIADSEEQVRRQTVELADHRQVVDAFGAQLLQLKERRNALSEARKDKWRREHQVAVDVRKLSEQLQRGESVLHSTMVYDVRRGLQAVREMSERGRVTGIFGPLIELVEPVDERFCTAMDEAAGGALFHVVVDTDDTAARIMRELERNSLGRLTFLPLNRLKTKDAVAYPTSDDVVPLIEKLRFSADVRRGVLTAFGKKLLCRDLATCVRFAEQTNMDCLTLDGDMVHRRGALNGGFKDPQRSRTRAMMDVRRAQRELDSVQDAAQKLRQEAQQADQQVTSVLGEIQKQEAEKQHAIAIYQRLHDELARARAHVESSQASVREKRRSLEQQEREVQELLAKVASLRAELRTPMLDTLSDAEIATLHALSRTISRLQSEERAHKTRLEELRAKKNAIETVLGENLVRRQTELTRQLGDDDGGGGLEVLEASERDEARKAKALDLANAAQAVAENAAALKDAERELARLQEEEARDTLILESLRAEDAALSEQLQDETRQAETWRSHQRRLQQKREDATRAIRELGTLPTAELEAFKHLSLRDVMREFATRTERLKSFSHVNKKALDQYVSFNEQRATLLARQQELDDGDAAIKELIDVLDKRKDEAILRTFKGVSHHFAEVFRELVPTGEGRMLILRADSDPVDVDDEDDDANNADGSGGDDVQAVHVDTFSGVQVKVSFRGEGDSYLMQQLSGGQKALVALAFIFAIQRCDPAPFYLFDEIDQALDSTHRAAVAALIHRQAHGENSAQVRLCVEAVIHN